jgi:hypothetical protein
MVRTAAATRYVTPLREGGSLPAIVEADDDGLYVLKFRGAGQGPRALVAELVAGEIGRALGLRVPEIVFLELDPALGRSEGDPEIKDLIEGSAGLNLGLDYLPGSLPFDPLTDVSVDGALASRITWFDAFVMNVDRTARNTNLLTWHGETWLIDHGAALYFHHRWGTARDAALSRFPAIRDHVLLPRATELEAAAEEGRARLRVATLEEIAALIPEAWLGCDEFATADDERQAYVDILRRRLESAAFVEEAIDARRHF